MTHFARLSKRLAFRPYIFEAEKEHILYCRGATNSAVSTFNMQINIILKSFNHIMLNKRIYFFATLGALFKSSLVESKLVTKE